ncbi:MAG: hypothetical protein ACW98I_15595 [Candidatus Hodarchaeales archaeon]
MPSLFFLLSSLNFLLIFILGLYDSYLLLLCLLPWTMIFYAIIIFKGVSFSDRDPIYQHSGKLYWIGRGAFQATLVASLNLIISAMIISNESISRFDIIFGPYSSILMLFLLPMPGFLLFLLNGKNQEHLYELMSTRILSSDEDPIFVHLTTELLTKYQRYSDEYYKQVELIRKSIHEYLKGNFPQISSFFDLDQSYHLNLENLALFVTKRSIEPVMGENKNIR